MNPHDLRFSPELLRRSPERGWDVVTLLRHFAIVTYAVEPARLRPLVHPRFDLDTIPMPDGSHCALVSVVPFQDLDFHFQALPWLRFTFGQTNYRSYVIDRTTGQRAVWFFGTTLDSWTVVVPHYLWRLPWHHAPVRLRCAYDAPARRYTRYQVDSAGGWAPLHLELADSGQPFDALNGFSTLETGLVLLTHPLRGFYYRRDGKLGSYTIWHDRLQPTRGSCLAAQITLLDQLGLVPLAEQQRPHSVMLQHLTEFSIYLPPSRLKIED